MGHSNRINLSDVRGVFRLLGDVRDLRHDVEAQERRIVDGLCEIVGAPMGWASSFSDARPGRDTAITRFVPGTVADPAWMEHLAWWGTISHVQDDGLLAKAVQRTDDADAICGSGVYETNEKQSYLSWQYLTEPLGIRDSLALWFRYPGTDDLRGYALQRQDRDGDFTDKQVRLAQLFAAELLGLHHAGRLEPGRVVDALPPRLRRLVPLLMTAMGQKQIAARTGLSYQTVRSYTKELYALLGVQSREELTSRMRG